MSRGAPLTRSTERTRRMVLDAAAQVVSERGTAATVGEIATAAGVSKSGLLHHFASRDALFRALVADLLQQLRALVLAHHDPADHWPGAHLRAYVRGLCGDDQVLRSYHAIVVVGTALDDTVGLSDLFAQDIRWWKELFASDGLDADRVLLVRAASEGLAVAAGYDPEVRDHDRHRALPLLVAMTNPTFRLPNSGLAPRSPKPSVW